MAQPFAHGGDIEKEAQVTFTQIAKGAKKGETTPIIIFNDVKIGYIFVAFSFSAKIYVCTMYIHTKANHISHVMLNLQ